MNASTNDVQANREANMIYRMREIPSGTRWVCEAKESNPGDLESLTLLPRWAWESIQRELGEAAPTPIVDGTGSETLFLWKFVRFELSLGFENDQPMWFWRGTMCGFKHFEPWDVDQPLPKWVASQLRIVKARS